MAKFLPQEQGHYIEATKMLFEIVIYLVKLRKQQSAVSSIKDLRAQKEAVTSDTLLFLGKKGV